MKRGTDFCILTISNPTKKKREGGRKLREWCGERQRRAKGGGLLVSSRVEGLYVVIAPPASTAKAEALYKDKALGLTRLC